MAVIPVSCGPDDPPPDRWLKGNLHTHSFWSDGDDFPESILSWYREAGYDFVALSDHNTLAEGERWIPVTEARLATLEKYVARFPGDWVEARAVNDTIEVRLKTFEEYSSLLNVPDSFLVIQAEEISDGFDGKPLHLNATNIVERITPQGGSSVTDVLQRNIDAVLAQAESLRVPILPHVNHPNFGWAVTPDDLVPLEGEHFFEVYNGHPAVHNEGDDGRPGTEAMWDYVNTQRLIAGGEVLYGLGVDDAHHYHEQRIGLANTGRAWIMVRARTLEPSPIIGALLLGDFYASSGVTLKDVRFDGSTLKVSIDAEEGVTYSTTFIGTRSPTNPGEVLGVVDGPEASYQMDGSELFVRATVISSKPMANPYRDGEVEMAWVQPMLPGSPR
ncbi:MAG: histidinol-phosphatase [Rhodothermales bacterium]|nr:histidinol-phosphatase [Rhodothermales bacterium]